MSDTSEITNGCLTHYDSSHIQTRRDFMGLCQYNREQFAERRKQEPNQECMAKIVRLLETLTDHAKTEWKLKALAAEEKGLRKPKEPKCYPITISNGVFNRLIYATFGETIIRNSLNYLVEIGYIGREQEKKNYAPVYWLEQTYIQALLKAQAEVILAGYDFKPPSYQGTISYPDGVISDPKSVNAWPGHSQAGSESTDNNIDNIGDNSLEKDKESTYGANTPTSAHLLKEVDEKLEEVEEELERITGEHPSVSPANETPYHIATSAIRKTEDEPTDPAVPAVTIGATHGTTSTGLLLGSHHRDAIHRGHNIPPATSGHQGRIEAPQLLQPESHQGVEHTPSQQAPGAGMPLPLAADPPVGRHGDAAGAQAHPLSAPTPAQATISPVAGSASAPTAQVLGFKPPKRPAGKRPPVMPEPPKEITLTPQEQAFWSLWCGVWFNKDVLPDLTATAYGHVKRLCPYITTAEMLDSLIDYARKDLQEAKGVKRKAVQLGNLVNSYRGWKQEQQAQGPPEEKPPMDKYTAASRDEERNERGLQRLRDMIIANGGKLPS